jgi:fumarate reductase flavoprotein subunit
VNSSSDTADFVVVGGGFGGLIAALRATELGLRVMLLEKGDGERYPCNSRLSGGIIHICLRDIRRKPEELYDAIIKATSGEVNKAQATALSQNASRLVDWLQQHGAKFMRFNMQEAYRWCMAPPRALVPGLDWIGRGPDVVLRELMGRFVAAGGHPLLRTKALRLIMHGGVCRGVVAQRDGVEIEYPASAVLIADGGFQADRDSFVQHIGPNFEAIFQRGAATSFGDGMRMAAQAGAKLTNLRPFYGHLLSREARNNEKLWPYPELDAFTTVGVIVGADGRRFTNEGAGGIAIANALARLPNPGSATAIFDARIWEGPGKAHRIPANPLLEQAGATIYRANTIEELAQLLKLPADTLAETVAKHNAAVDTGDFSGLTPPRHGAVNAFPIRTAPFMAINLIPGITYTMGGIEIDGSGRVISTGGAPIRGLFAAGSATGGLEGGGHNAYVGGIVKAGLFGLLAAEEAARVIKKTDVDTAAGTQTNRFPILNMIVHYGGTAAVILAAFIALLAAWVSWHLLDWLAIPAAAVAGVVLYVLIRSYVEIVTLIMDMLAPR